MSVKKQDPIRSHIVIEFPASAQERATVLERVLWGSDGQLDMKVLELLSLSPSVPQAFRGDFVADMLDVIDQLVSTASDRATIARRLAYEYGSNRDQRDFPGKLQPSKATRQPISDEAMMQFMDTRGIPMDRVESESAQKERNEERKEQTIEGLWKEYLMARSLQLRNRIVVHYSPMVHLYAAHFSRNLTAQTSYDEICSAAFDGLIGAVEAYDPEQKAEFEAFCHQRIIAAVKDWMRCLNPKSEEPNGSHFSEEVHASREAVDTDLELDLSRAELFQRLERSLDRYDYLSRLSQPGKETHFSAMEPPHDRRQQDSLHRSEMLPTHSEDPAAGMSRRLLAEYLTKGFSREERLVLVLYYFEEMTMAEIGSVLNLSESRVSEIHEGILQSLRTRFEPSSAEGFSWLKLRRSGVR